MPDSTAGQSRGASLPAAVDRISQLKPPGQLDFNSASLSTSWKRWKEEVELYMDLAISGKDENKAVSLSHLK